MLKTKYFFNILIIFFILIIPKISSANVDLSDWEQQGRLGNGNWEPSGPNNEIILQTINGNPTFYVSPNNFINGIINGTFKVRPDYPGYWEDNDWMGFVFGYQGPIKANNDAERDYDFYLFDWKKGDQGQAKEGYTLAKVKGPATDAEFWDRNDTGPTGRFDVLQTKYGDFGWTEGITYYFQLEYKTNNVKIYVSADATIDASDLIFTQNGTFQAGRFGFFNQSQSYVEYGNFTSQGEPPEVNADTYIMSKNSTLLTTTGNGVLSNDQGSILGNLTAELQSDVSNGTLNLNNDGTFTYTPSTNYTGTDSFTYRAFDGTNYSSTTVATITITPNNPPVITEGALVEVTMSKNARPTAFDLTLNATDLDNDTLTWSIFTPASNGTASVDGQGNSKQINYSPNNNWTGTDTFFVQVDDSNFGTDVIEIKVNVVPPAPLVAQATYNTDTQITVDWNYAGYTSYKIERRTDIGNGFGQYTQIGISDFTTFVDNSTNYPADPPQENERYQYRVAPLFSTSTQENGTSTWAEVPYYVYTTPAAPTIQSPTADSSTAITWNWTDNAAFEELFKIEFSTGAGTDVDVNASPGMANSGPSTSINLVHNSSLQNNTLGASLGSPQSILIKDNYAYVASTISDAIEIIDISDPDNPTYVSSIKDGDGGAKLNGPRSIYISGNYAYVGSYYSNAMEIVDISNPANPIHVGVISDGDGGALLDKPENIYVKNNFAYVISYGSKSLEIIDISDKSNPIHAGSITNGTGGALLRAPKSIKLSGNYAYISSLGDDAIEIIDISDKTNPTHAGAISNGDGGALLDGVLDIYIKDNYIYAAANRSNALEIIDISNPTNPTHISSITDGDGGALLKQPKSVHISGNHAYVGAPGYESVAVINISNPANPSHVASIKNGDGGALLDGPNSIFVKDNYIYVSAMNSNALEVIKLNETTSVNTGSNSLSFQSTDLTPNTQYGVDIRAFRYDRGSSKPTTTSPLIYTLANIPTNLKANRVREDNIKLSWDANQNPDYTKYYLFNETNNTDTGWKPGASIKIKDLTCDTTYAFKVKARNEDGIETIYSKTIDIKTNPCGTDPVVDFGILINNGDEITTSRNVTLGLSAHEDTVSMEISHDPNFDEASIIPFQETFDYDLCRGNEDCAEGPYIVYAKFYDEEGVASKIVSDGIIYKPIVEEVVPDAPACEIDSSKVTYDLYIVNPNGEERHTNTKYTVVDDLGNNVYVVNFEDKGLDFDYDDIRIKVDRSDIEKIIVTAVDFDAKWHHQIKVKFFYQGMEADILLWSDSHLVAGKKTKYNSKLINLCDYASLFEKKEFTFIKNLHVDVTDLEVKILQKFLNNHGFQIAERGPGSPGNETEYFNHATKAALTNFQNKYKDKVLTPFGLTRGTGYFGPATRNYINSLKVYSDGSSKTQPDSGELDGLILLQVEEHGEAWYVYPEDSKRYYLGRPKDAFSIMRELGLGANHSFITQYTVYPDRVAGKILIDVDDAGKAYYIYPKNKKAYYLGRPADAFRVMRELGLGISNKDIATINEGQVD